MESKQKQFSAIQRSWIKRLLVGASILFVGVFISYLSSRAFPIDFSDFNQYTLSVLILAVLLVVLISLRWPKPAGYLYLLTYVAMMVMVRFVWDDGIPIVSVGFPMLPFGVFYVLYGHVVSGGPFPDTDEQWKRGLRLSMTVITVIYLMGMVAEMIRTNYEFWSKPYYFMFPLLLLFLIAFILSWRNEMVAGSLLMLWYLGVIILSEASPWIGENVGPFKIYSFPGAVMGFLFLVYWYRIKPKDLMET